MDGHANLHGLLNGDVNFCHMHLFLALSAHLEGCLIGLLTSRAALRDGAPSSKRRGGRETPP